MRTLTMDLSARFYPAPGGEVWLLLRIRATHAQDPAAAAVRDALLHEIDRCPLEGPTHVSAVDIRISKYTGKGLAKIVVGARMAAIAGKRYTLDPARRWLLDIDRCRIDATDLVRRFLAVTGTEEKPYTIDRLTLRMPCTYDTGLPPAFDSRLLPSHLQYQGVGQTVVCIRDDALQPILTDARLWLDAPRTRVELGGTVFSDDAFCDYPLYTGGLIAAILEFHTELEDGRVTLRGPSPDLVEGATTIIAVTHGEEALPAILTPPNPSVVYHVRQCLIDRRDLVPTEDVPPSDAPVVTADALRAWGRVERLVNAWVRAHEWLPIVSPFVAHAQHGVRSEPHVRT